jgi:competence protein ComEC
VVLTHPHDDHMSGLPAVLRRLEVGLLLDSGESAHAPHYEEMLDIVRDRRLPYRVARRGQQLNLGGGVHAFVLTPLEPRLRGTHSDLNNNAIAIKIVYRQFSALLGADLEREAEARLLEHGDRLQSTMLKAGHHGSKTSSTAEFLRAVRPAVTLISCGPSAFLHPAPETLERLVAAKTRVYRTDLHGALTLRSDGTQYQVSTFKDGVVTDWTECGRRE